MTLRIRRTHIQVPATSANLGPGFDCMALALDLWNDVILEATEGDGRVSIEGEGARSLPKDGRNMVAQAASQVFQKAGDAGAGFTIECMNRIPVSSGMGSSAAAAVGGLIAANAAIGNPYSRQNLIQLCLPLETHADNSVAAFVGGLVILSVEDGRVLWRRYELPQMRVSVIVPEKHLSTGESRSLLPEKVDHRDAVFNLGRVLLTAEALRSADYRLLAEAMQDRLHQPYRMGRLPGVEEIIQAAKQAGAAAAVLSGAGPGVIAFADSGLDEIQTAMLAAAREQKLAVRGFILHISNTGANEKEAAE
ncbi:MAG: homoserine kinase [Anaerolineales bacterium]|nr:homoserine kinase [Anaerolineales bacterium]